MSLTGGVSFFEKSKILYDESASATASSNSANANLALGNDKFFKWESNGSSDGDTQTLTITPNNTITASRLFILGHNLKDFTVSVTGQNITGLESGFTADFGGAATLVSGDIDQDDLSTDTAYYEFDSVSITELVISATHTQVADEEKRITQVILTDEIGTLTGYPEINGVSIDPDLKSQETIAGGFHIERGRENASFDMRLSTYPLQDDVDILDGLFDRTDPFLVWLCGGKPNQFTRKTRGWRAEDLYQMKVENTLNNGYFRNVYSLGVNQRYSFKQVVS